MSDVDAYKWHRDILSGDTNKTPKTIQCGWYCKPGRKAKTPAIIFRTESVIDVEIVYDLTCFIGDEKVDAAKWWPILSQHPISAKSFVAMGGVDPRGSAVAKPAAKEPSFKTFDGGDGLLPYLTEFVADGQRWMQNNKGISDRETAQAAGVWLKKSRALYATLVSFQGVASEKQFEQMSGQLQSVAESAKLIIAPWVAEHDGEEIAGLTKDNISVVKERYAKIEDMEMVLKHFLEKRNKVLMNALQRMCDFAAKNNHKVPGMKVLIKEVSASKDD